MRCVSCNHEALDRGTVEETVQVGEMTFIANVPAMVCGHCGEDYLSIGTMRQLSLQVAEILARKGIRSAEAFRFMRKRLGIKAVELSELLGVAAETISRWENGERLPETRALRMLGALVIERAEGKSRLLDYLRSLLELENQQPDEQQIHLAPKPQTYGYRSVELETGTIATSFEGNFNVSVGCTMRYFNATA